MKTVTIVLRVFYTPRQLAVVQTKAMVTRASATRRRATLLAYTTL